MTKKAFLVLKGFFLGLANLIPGVSGGTVAVTLGIYEYLVDAINGLTKKFKENFNKLLPIAIGVVLCFISMSKVITLALDKYQFATIMFFIGLIMGGINILFKKVKGKASVSNFIWLALAFGFVMFLVLVQNGTAPVTLAKVRIVDIPLLIVLGIISAASMVIPGVSGSFVLMLLGYYKEIVSTVGDLTNFSHLGHNLIILIPFGIGVLLGIFLITRIIKKLLEKYETKVYFGVLGFVIASIIGIVLSIEPFKVTVWNILIGVVTFIWGFLVTRALMKENKE